MKISPKEHPPARRQPILTLSQWQAYRTLHDYATLHFEGGENAGDTPLRARLFPLICGPTGSGKSMIVEQVAHEIGAEYLRITYGDWVPAGGAKDPAMATLVRVGRALSRNDRLVLHLDELDKLLISDKEWGRSVMTDVWNVLDCQLPWEQIALVELMSAAAEAESAGQAKSGARGAKGPPPLPKNFRKTDHLWIVGSGTWQSVFEQQEARSIGFQAGRTPNQACAQTSNIVAAIRASKVIPTELTARFSTDFVVINYPNREETDHLLEATGLNALALDLGVGITPDDVDYAAAGMRALESLRTRLLLAKLRQLRSEAPPEPMIEDLNLGPATSSP